MQQPRLQVCFLYLLSLWALAVLGAPIDTRATSVTSTPASTITQDDALAIQSREDAGEEETTTYQPGWCTVQARQFQHDSNDHFSLKIYDDAGNLISAEGGGPSPLDSELPHALIASSSSSSPPSKTRRDDDDDDENQEGEEEPQNSAAPVYFAYASQSWSTLPEDYDLHRCSVGGWELTPPPSSSRSVTLPPPSEAFHRDIACRFECSAPPPPVEEEEEPVEEGPGGEEDTLNTPQDWAATEEAIRATFDVHFSSKWAEQQARPPERHANSNAKGGAGAGAGAGAAGEKE